jgi:hypothetical protein
MCRPDYLCLGDSIQYEGFDVGCPNVRPPTMEFDHGVWSGFQATQHN